MDYKKAAKQKLRYLSSAGAVSTEQLFDLSIEDLDKMAVNYQKEYKISGEKSFLIAKSKKDRVLKLKFDIVLDVLTTKLADAEKASKSADTKAMNQKILTIIAEKRDGALGEKSIEELEAMLK